MKIPNIQENTQDKLNRQENHFPVDTQDKSGSNTLKRCTRQTRQQRQD